MTVTPSPSRRPGERRDGLPVTRLPPSPRHARIRGGVAVVLLVGAIICLVAAQFYPVNYIGAERYTTVATSVLAIIAAAILAFFAWRAATLPSFPVSFQLAMQVSYGSLQAAAVVGFLWLIFVPGGIISLVSEGPSSLGVTFFLAMPSAIGWLGCIVLGTMSLRVYDAGRPIDRRDRKFGLIGLAIGMVIWIATVLASVLYAVFA